VKTISFNLKLTFVIFDYAMECIDKSAGILDYGKFELVNNADLASAHSYTVSMRTYLGFSYSYFCLNSYIECTVMLPITLHTMII
jgi:hypothetical protein